jgi:hypothetical protein
VDHDARAVATKGLNVGLANETGQQRVTDEEGGLGITALRVRRPQGSRVSSGMRVAGEEVSRVCIIRN